MRKYLLLVLFSALVFPSLVLAGLGVGVGTGKMVVDELLYPGTLYELPILTVINTGDVSARYGVGISHRENQPELRPDPSWFSFSPKEFALEPTAMQNVEISLNLPLRLEPGKYFAFVEGHPLPDPDKGGTSIGLAAASKLYFEVAPANIFVGLYYRALTFWKNHLPWSNIIGGVIVGLLVIRFLRSRFSFSVSKKASKSAKPTKPEADE